MIASSTQTRSTTVRRLESITPHALWPVQGILALIFLFAGSMKFIMPLEDMQRDIAFPAWFLYFIGAAEVLGALGLVLPGILNIRRGLTPLAGMGLIAIMVGATVTTIAVSGVLPALFPFVVGLLASFVVWRRWSWFNKS